MKSADTEPAPDAAALVEVRRGAIVESRHRGHIVAIDGQGEVVARLGTPETVTFMRSSAKPHQVLPLVTSGAADRFRFTEREIAIACGSHSGEAVHVATVEGMLEKIGLSESALKCGVHEPFDRQTAREMREQGKEPHVLQNNCSGKHTAMLALSVHLGAPTETYDHPTHPVQLAAIRTVADFSGFQVENIAIGVDGCGVPVFGLSIQGMALMYARLVTSRTDFEPDVADACTRVVDAMGRHPELVGGTRERFDTEVMRATEGRVISKVGAEGVYTAGVLPCERWPNGLGLAFKIEDGEDRRARPTVAIESLRQLGVLNQPALQKLAPYSKFPINNHRGDLVGSISPRFVLQRVG